MNILRKFNLNTIMIILVVVIIITFLYHITNIKETFNSKYIFNDNSENFDYSDDEDNSENFDYSNDEESNYGE